MHNAVLRACAAAGLYKRAIFIINKIVEVARGLPFPFWLWGVPVFHLQNSLRVVDRWNKSTTSIERQKHGNSLGNAGTQAGNTPSATAYSNAVAACGIRAGRRGLLLFEEMNLGFLMTELEEVEEWQLGPNICHIHSYSPTQVLAQDSLEQFFICVHPASHGCSC